MMTEPQTGYSWLEIPSVGDRVIVDQGEGYSIGVVNNTPSVGNTVGYLGKGLYGGSYTIGDTVMTEQMEESRVGVKSGIGYISTASPCFSICNDTQYLYVVATNGDIKKFTHELEFVSINQTSQTSFRFITTIAGILYIPRITYGASADSIRRYYCSDLSFIDSTDVSGSLFDIGDTYAELDYVYITCVTISNPVQLFIRKNTRGVLNNTELVSPVTSHGAIGQYYHGICGDGTYIYHTMYDAIEKRQKSNFSLNASTSITSRGLGCTSDGNYLYVAHGTKIIKYNCSDLSYVSEISTVGSSSLIDCYDVCYYGSFLFIADNGANKIYRINLF